MIKLLAPLDRKLQFYTHQYMKISLKRTLIQRPNYYKGKMRPFRRRLQEIKYKPTKILQVTRRQQGREPLRTKVRFAWIIQMYLNYKEHRRQDLGKRKSSRPSKRRHKWTGSSTVEWTNSWKIASIYWMTTMVLSPLISVRPRSTTLTMGYQMVKQAQAVLGVPSQSTQSCSNARTCAISSSWQTSKDWYRSSKISS